MISPDHEIEKRDFPTTSYTLFQRIHSRSPTECKEALNEFFLRYWVPLYFFLRNRGESHEQASDLLQSFVEREIIDRGQLAQWNPEKGKLRTFLKTCLDRFRKKAIRSDMAQKRGGNKAATHISLDLDWAGSYYEDRLSSGGMPDVDPDYEWAAAVVNQATQELAESYVKKGKKEEFLLLLQNLENRGEGQDKIDYGEIAERLDTTTEAVKQRMRVFRSRFQQYLRRVVADSVAPDEVADELEFLLDLLRR